MYYKILFFFIQITSSWVLFSQSKVEVNFSFCNQGHLYTNFYKFFLLQNDSLIKVVYPEQMKATLIDLDSTEYQIAFVNFFQIKDTIHFSPKDEIVSIYLDNLDYNAEPSSYLELMSPDSYLHYSIQFGGEVLSNGPEHNFLIYKSKKGVYFIHYKNKVKKLTKTYLTRLIHFEKELVYMDGHVESSSNTLIKIGNKRIFISTSIDKNVLWHFPE